MRKRNKYGFALSLMWLISSLICAGEAEAKKVEVKEPEKVTWQDVRRWALGSDMKPKRVPEEEAEGSDTKATHSDWKPAGRNQRRRLPNIFVHWYAQIRFDAEKLRAGHAERENYFKAFQNALRADDMAWALVHLHKMVTAKTVRSHVINGSVYFNLWMLGISVKDGSRNEFIPKERVDGYFKQWQAQRSAWIEGKSKNPNWHYRKREEARLKSLVKFFEEEAETLRDTLLLLDQKGDQDPTALWELCGRFSSKRPYRPMWYLKTLVKLRTWYPAFKHVASGEVQWRMATLLYRDESRFRDSADAYELLANEFKAHPKVKDGSALWLAAETRQKEGRKLIAMGRRKQGTYVLGVALARCRSFQEKYPLHHHNQVFPGVKKHPKISACQFQINVLNGLLSGKKK